MVGGFCQRVSVLFSEPKIPQLVKLRRTAMDVNGFSALQRAENSSILSTTQASTEWQSFSALQRAENSSISLYCSHSRSPSSFQCSSASRKFLNGPSRRRQRRSRQVSVLFSEPKIPQSGRSALSVGLTRCVSVLFSEPKIPQLLCCSTIVSIHERFQCSSASRKFLNRY